MFVCCTPKVYICNFLTKLNANANANANAKLKNEDNRCQWCHICYVHLLCAGLWRPSKESAVHFLLLISQLIIDGPC